MILIVDDKQENLFSLKALLRVNAYDVDTASSGEEALKKLLRNDYSLMILDVQMPGMDGYEVAEAVTSLNRTKDIPIIFLSAVNIDKRFITRGYQSGGVDYVTKPFDNDLLLLKVKTFKRLAEQQRNLRHIQEALKTEVETRKMAQSELEKMNSSLEENVAQRTEELLVLNRGLESKNTELAQYVSLASHDLQEPLRKIITFSRIIDDKFLGEMPEAHRNMQKVIESCERMRNLINDLLNYSKLSAESIFTKTNLQEILANTIADIEIAIEEKAAIIEAADLPAIEAIPGQMRQLFQNIITNALKFSRSDTAPVIQISFDFIKEKELNAPAEADGDFIRICIKDNGIGFDENYQDRIFTIFQRLHGRSEYEGTGIGLAIVKKIVEKHSGIVAARGKENEGAVFIIILPVFQKREKYLSATL